MCLGTVNQRGVHESLNGREAIIATVVSSCGQGLFRVFGIYIRVIERSLNDDSSDVSIRAVNACTRSPARSTHAGLRVFMGNLSRFYLVFILRRTFRFDLDFNVVHQNRPLFNFLDRLFS